MLITSCRVDYVYKPLSTGIIRVLSRAKSSPEDEENYTLTHISPRASTKYCALSYTWGDGAADRDLVIQESCIPTGHSVIKIRANLKACLRRVFHMFPDISLWVDAVCINQCDVDEKNVQVPMMTEVYSLCERAIIWLGDASEEMNTAIHELDQIHGASRLISERVWIEDDILHSHGLPKASSPIWIGLMELLSLPWWTRVWTIQEAILPKNLVAICGQHSFDLEILLQLCHLLTKLKISAILRRRPLIIRVVEELIRESGKHYRPAGFGVKKATWLRSARNDWHQKGPLSVKLDHLLDQANYRFATEKVDYVYGVLGLARPEVRQYLQINYGKSVTDVFLSYGRFKISDDGSGEILQLATSCIEPRGVPSWCPTFTKAHIPHRLWEATSDCGFEASGALLTDEMRARLSPISDEACFRGFTVDKVKVVVPGRARRMIRDELPGLIASKATKALASAMLVAAEEPFPMDKVLKAERAVLDNTIRAAAETLEWQRQCLMVSQETYPQDGEVPRAHWVTLTCTSDIEFEQPEYMASLEFISNIRAGKRYLDPDIHRYLKDSNPQTARYFDFLMDCCAYRRFFATHGGRIGLGPLHLAEGDLICIIYGATTPIILRPCAKTESEELKYMNIGECYVHGMMRGEALKEESAIVIETFTVI